MLNVAELIVHELEAAGVSHLFGVPGYANAPIFLGTRGRSVTPVLARHEEGSGWMAYGYAAGSGHIGACTATSGPGALHLVAPVAAAYANSLPLLVITGQVETPKFGRGGFQEMTGRGARNPDVMSIFSSITKRNEMITSADGFHSVLRRALRDASSGRPGPVHLNIPVDVQKLYAQQIACGDAAHGVPARVGASAAAAHASQDVDAASLRLVTDAIAKADAPLLLFGRGCLWARELAASLVRRSALPFATTMQFKGMVAPESLQHLGFVGVAGSPRANAYLQSECDLIIAVGTSLNEFTLNGYDLGGFARARLIHVDIDPAVQGRSVKPALSLVSDSRAFLSALDASLTAWRFADSKGGFARAVSTADRAPVVPLPADPQGRIAPHAAIACLEENAPDRAVFVGDSGNNAVWLVHYLRMRDSQEFHIDINTGCMGSGVVSCVGLWLARPERPIFSVCGDGGFMMLGNEVASAVELGADITWVVLNDLKLGMVWQGYVERYGIEMASSFEQADVGSMAAAMGAQARVVRTEAQLREALAERARLRGPLIIDVRIDDRYLPQVYARAKAATRDFAREAFT